MVTYSMHVPAYINFLCTTDQNVMLPLLTSLLRCVCSNSLPCSAKIEVLKMHFSVTFRSILLPLLLRQHEGQTSY